MRSNGPFLPFISLLHGWARCAGGAGFIDEWRFIICRMSCSSGEEGGDPTSPIPKQSGQGSEFIENRSWVFFLKLSSPVHLFICVLLFVQHRSANVSCSSRGRDKKEDSEKPRTVRLSQAWPNEENRTHLRQAKIRGQEFTQVQVNHSGKCFDNSS